jgi:hypothetical protein
MSHFDCNEQIFMKFWFLMNVVLIYVLAMLNCYEV